jgi:FkbM family methyltransferase
MKRATVASHTLWVPDNVADWDAVAGDSPWERERTASIIENMGPDKLLYDVGAEHGWLSAIYAHESSCRMVLIEPTDDFWPNIKGCWSYNGLPVPIATVHAYCSDRVEAGTNGGPHTYAMGWPPQAEGPESMARDYFHMQHGRFWEPGHVTIDYLAPIVGQPDGITVDVEGAELLVMKGAATVLEERRPLVWISVHPDLMVRDYGHHPDQLFGYMLGKGYKAQHLATDHEQHYFFQPS